jgi:predicted permease
VCRFWQHFFCWHSSNSGTIWRRRHKNGNAGRSTQFGGTIYHRNFGYQLLFWKKDSVLNNIKKIFKTPPFIAFLAALVVNFFSIEIPKDIDDVFKLASTTVPLALISVGSQMQWKKLEPKENFYLLWGLLFKLIIFPLIILIIYKFLFHQSGEMIEISILEAAMAPMITAAIIAASHNLEPKLCNLIVAIGIPVSFITLAAWYFILQIL